MEGASKESSVCVESPCEAERENGYLVALRLVVRISWSGVPNMVKCTMDGGDLGSQVQGLE